MDHNPYAPPKATVGDPVTHGLKRRSVVVMIVFTLVSLGLYVPIWFFRRHAALNRLDSPRKVMLWPIAGLASALMGEFLIGMSIGAGYPPNAVVSAIATALPFVRLCFGIATLWQCFVIKDILEDHLSGPDDDGSPQMFRPAVKLSGLLTFFFGIYYLQHIINRDIVAANNAVV